jgi:hypothetical protein
MPVGGVDGFVPLFPKNPTTLEPATPTESDGALIDEVLLV